MPVEVKNIVIPTYMRGDDNPYPPLSFGGNKKEVYPYSLQDDIDIELLKHNFIKQKYRMVCISNGLLEALVMPDMNGRVYSLKNIKSGREIFYRNHVVKPGLIALRGAWISGGIEFNTPSLGHSVSSVSPVFWEIVDNENESGVIVGTIDRSTRLCWTVKISLKPGRMALDIQTSIYNPNHYRERLYYWENCAVPATEDLRFVCNGKWTCGNKISPWPVRNGIDYSQHTNNLLPVDHFGYLSQTDFFGAYYPNHRLGTYHLGLRAETAGQKYFSWGINEDNKIWEKFLTDTDGQYIELQSGLLESQHISSWLGAGKSVSVSGCWFGSENTGEITWANNKLAIAFEKNAKKLKFDLIPIELDEQCCINIRFSDGTEKTTEIFLSSGKNSQLELENQGDFTITVINNKKEIILQKMFCRRKEDQAGKIPINWRFEKSINSEIIAIEDEIKYHCWTNAMNLTEQLKSWNRHLLSAEIHFKTHQLNKARKSLDSVFKTAPEHSRAHQLAAAVLLREYRLTAKEELAWQITDHCQMTRRNGALPAAGLAIWGELAILQGRLLEAAEIFEKSARDNSMDMAPVILAGLARKLNRKQTAEKSIDLIVVPGIYKGSEKFLLSGDKQLLLQSLPSKNAVRADVIDYIENIVECLLFYWRLKWFSDLNLLLAKLMEIYPELAEHPIINLLYADISTSVSGKRKAVRKAEKCSVSYIFPAGWERYVLLERGLKMMNNKSPALKYLLALFKLQNNQVKEALLLLNSCRRIPENIELERMVSYSLAQWNRYTGNYKDETRYLTRALNNGGFDWRIFLQLDEVLHNQHLTAPRERIFKNIPEECFQRGSIAYAYARFLADKDRIDEALEIIRTKRFSQFEGQADTRRLYVDCLLLSGMKMLIDENYEGAAKRLKKVFEFPENIGSASYLGEHGRLASFLLGVISFRNNEPDKAGNYWREVLDKQDYSYNGAAFRKYKETRADEIIAAAFAASVSGEKKTAENLKTEIAELRRKNTGAAGTALAAAEQIVKGNIIKARQTIKTGRSKYCCSNLLKILELLETIVPVNKSGIMIY